MGPTKVCTLNSVEDDRNCLKRRSRAANKYPGTFSIKRKWYCIQDGDVQLSRDTRDGMVTNVKDSEETVTESMENGKALHFHE